MSGRPGVASVYVRASSQTWGRCVLLNVVVWLSMFWRHIAGSNEKWIERGENGLKMQLEKYDFTGGKTLSLFEQREVQFYWEQAAVKKQRRILLEFFEATGGEMWMRKYNWGKGDPCLDKWFGVRCNEQIQVIGLSLSSNNLQGSIPDSLGDLDTLMDDHPNRLAGSIPPKLYTLQHLRVLLLDGNELIGVIEDDIRNLRRITYLDLSHNRLFGKMPEGLFECRQLVELRLKNNLLSGTISKSIGNLNDLEFLDLGDNGFEGLIPELEMDCHTQRSDLKEMRMLSYLNTKGTKQGLGYGERLEEVEMDEYIEFELANVQDPSATPSPTFQNPFMPIVQPPPKRIQTIRDDYRALVDLYRAMRGPLWVVNHGWIADSYKAFHRRYSDPCLEHWYAVTCNDVGRIVKLDLNENRLGGTFPKTIAALQHLQELRVSGNEIEGSMDVLLSLKSLKVLEVQRNLMAGSIPRSISDLEHLEVVNLADNAISGGIPKELETLKSLQSFLVADNELDGEIEIDLGVLENLKFFDIGNNKVHGQLKMTVKHDKATRAKDAARLLDESERLSTGSIVAGEGVEFPSEGRYGKAFPTTQQNPPVLPQLMFLKAMGNELTGTLPEMLLMPPRLMDISLRANKLRGGLSHLIYPNQTDLTSIDLSNNHFDSTIPESDPKSIQLPSGQCFFSMKPRKAYVLLDPTLFVHLKRLTDLVSLQLSNNRFEGKVDSVNMPVGLYSLNASNNRLTGHIPGLDYKEYKKLRLIDLEHNKIEGYVPDFLEHADQFEGMRWALAGNELWCPIPPWQVVLDATCHSRSCPEHWESNGKFCVKCTNYATRYFGSTYCSSCQNVTLASKAVSPMGGSLSCGQPNIITWSAASKEQKRWAEKHWDENHGPPEIDAHYEDGSYYMGQFRWGVPHGLGRMVYIAEVGEVYEGEFVRGKRKGIGKLLPPKWLYQYGGMAIYGEFGDGGDYWRGELNGQGYARYVDGTTYEGTFKDGLWEGIGMLVNPKGDAFAGMFLNNQFNGPGVMEYYLGARYEGNWENGLMHGFGTLYFANGNVYQGNFETGMIQGDGIMWFWNGDVYKGDFRDAIPHGRGNFSWAEDDDYVTYSGQWQAGVPEGRGTMVYRTGRVYDGQFTQGLRHGRGQIYLPIDSSAEEGEEAIIEPRVIELGAFRSDVKDGNIMMNPSRVLCRFGGCEVTSLTDDFMTPAKGAAIFSSKFLAFDLAAERKAAQAAAQQPEIGGLAGSVEVGQEFSMSFEGA